MHPPRVQLFESSEYDRRLSDVRKLMTTSGLDALLVHRPENIYYLSGYQTPGYYWHMALVVPLNSDPVLIPPPHEASLVPEFCWVEDVRIFPDTSDWASVTASVLRDKKLAAGAIGVEDKSWFLTADLRHRIGASLPDAELRGAGGMIESCRLIKSPQELQYMRNAAAMSGAGMKAGIDAVEAGATELEVASAVHSALDLAGSEYTGLPAFITSGSRSELVHATWSGRTISTSELVFLEIPGSCNRYHAVHSRSVFVGEPSDLVHRADAVSRQALSAAKREVRPGTPMNRVFEAGRSVIDDADIGYKQGRRIAYGIGVAFPPGWDEGDILSINHDESQPLKAGMSFHLITTMRLAGLGAFGCSDTVLVTDAGCETLTTTVDPGVKYRD